MSAIPASQKPIDVFLRLLLVTLLIVWCLLIARPFLVIIVWAIIIAVAIYPIYKVLLKLYRGRKGLAVSTFLIVLLALIIAPSIKLARTVVSHTDYISTFIKDPEAQFPEPNEDIRQWPVVGEQVFGYWSSAYDDLEEFIKQHSEEVSQIVGWLVKGLGTILSDVFISVISLVVAGFLLYTSEGLFKGVLKFANRLIGVRGDHFVTVARDTIRSVVQGILLVAIIQSVMAYVGFAIIGIKGAAIFAILVLILAVIQLPVILVTLPLAIYVFSFASTTAAVIFAIYMVVLGTVDNILKPIFLARGVDIPMIIIIVGSLGGLVLHGILGLFVGAVVMAIGYQTYLLWIEPEADAAPVVDELEMDA